MRKDLKDLEKKIDIFIRENKDSMDVLTRQKMDKCRMDILLLSKDDTVSIDDLREGINDLIDEFHKSRGGGPNV